jgi:hypothetical protein
MDEFLNQLNQEIEVEKNRYVSEKVEDLERVKQLWKGREISKEDKEKFAQIFDKADVKRQQKISRTPIYNKLTMSHSIRRGIMYEVVQIFQFGRCYFNEDLVHELLCSTLTMIK